MTRWLRGPSILVWLSYGLAAWVFRGYTTDDTAIYARFARHLARTGVLAFNPGEAVHAATSPLWAAIGALGDRLGLDALGTLHVAGVICGVASALLLLAVLDRLRPAAGLRWAVAAVVATAPWSLRWAWSGMETPLASLLVCALMVEGLQPEQRVRPGRLGLYAGLLPLVRPEGILLAALVALAAAVRPVLRARPRLWVGLLAPLALWSVYALPVYHHLLPATMQAKSTPLGLQPARLWANLRVIATILIVGGAVPAIAWVVHLLRRVAGLLGRGGWGRARIGGEEETFFLEPALLAWSAALPLVYLLRDVQVVSRYLEVIAPVILWAALKEARRWSRPAMRMALLQAALSVVLVGTWVGPSARAFGSSLRASLGDIATWLRENTPEDATVAVYDIGWIGLYSGRRVLDLGGLVHPGINDLRDRVDDEEILRRGLFLRFERPDYLVDRDARPAALDGAVLGGEVRLRAVLSREVANLGLSRSTPVVYTLYQVEPVEDRPERPGGR